jgi:hypothetical protein
MATRRAGTGVVLRSAVRSTSQVRGVVLGAGIR